MTESLGEIYAASLETAEFNRGLEREIYLSLLRRKQTFDDKLRFGLFALNGASLISLISALGGGGSVAKWLGFNQDIAVWSAAAFVVGIVAIGASLQFQQSLESLQAAHGFGRMSAASSVVSQLRMPHNEKSIETFERLMGEYGQQPLVGFQFSLKAIALQNLSAGAWLFGISLPLAHAFGWS